MITSISIISSALAAEAAGDAGGMPQLNPEYFSTQLFWLVVTFTVLYIAMAKKVVPAIRTVLEQRQSRIEQDLDRARQLQAQAEEAEATYLKAFDEAKSRSNRTIAEMQARVEGIASDTHASLDAELQQKLTDADTAINASVARAQQELKPAVEAISAAIVEQVANVAADKKAVATAVAAEMND